MEEPVIETGSWANTNPTWANTHTGLIDNAGLSGTDGDVTSSKCGVVQNPLPGRAALTLKLAEPRTVVKLQLAGRTSSAQGMCGITRNQGKNVRVQVGSSPQYNTSDPVCMEVGQLAATGGLVDYVCDHFHEGQYIIFSNDQDYLTICEAKVFVQAGKTTPPPLKF